MLHTIQQRSCVRLILVVVDLLRCVMAVGKPAFGAYSATYCDGVRCDASIDC